MPNTRADMGNHGLDLDGGFVGQHALHALIYFIDPGVAGNSWTSSLRMCEPYRFFTHLSLYRRLHHRLVEGQPLDLLMNPGVWAEQDPYLERPNPRKFFTPSTRAFVSSLCNTFFSAKSAVFCAFRSFGIPVLHTST